MPLKALCLAIVLAIAGSDAVLAQGRIGTAVRVVNQVTADKSLIITGDGVSQNQTVEVAPDSLGELKLDDSTKVALGPGAKLVLDKFVYDPNKSSGDVAVSLTKGAFRFITGAAEKKNYKIKTPSAAISVRGTVFDIYIAPDGGEWLLLHEGSIKVCNARSECSVLENPCQVLQLSPAGVVGRPGFFSAQPGSKELPFDEAFPFVKAPPSVDPVVYHTRLQVETNQCPNPNQPQRQDFTPVQRADLNTPSGPSSPGPRSNPPSGNSPDAPGSIPEPATPDAPSPVNWTGIYVGVNGGRGSGDQTTEIGCEDTENFFDFTLGSCGRVVGNRSASSQTYETPSSGFMGGVTGGFNFQAGPAVFGVESDIAYSEVDSAVSRATGGIPNQLGATTINQDLKWLSTVRGRVGLAVRNVMVFATGGLALAEVDYDYSLVNPRFFDLSASDTSSEVKTGWTAGGGFELALGLWSIKTEYLYVDLGTERLNAKVFVPDFTTGAPVDTRTSYAPEFDSQYHVFRTGLSLRLN
jgi:opacity protein-like surface antigen